MRKLIHLLAIVLIFIFWSVIPSAAQDLEKAQQDSIEYERIHTQAETYFNQAFRNEDNLSNIERIALYHKADTIFQDLEDWGYSFVSLTYLCNLYLEERDYEKIDQCSKAAIDLFPNKLTEESNYFGYALNLRANALWDHKKDYTNAIKLFKKSLAISKKNNLTLLRIAFFYFNLADCYREIGDYDQTIEYANNALRIQLDSTNSNPNLTLNIYNQLGFCYSQKKQFNLAVQNFKAGINYAKTKAIKDREGRQIILYLYQNLADLYLKEKQFDTAQQYISTALAFQKDEAFLKDAYTHELQGKVFLATNKNKIALASFQKSTASAKLEHKDATKHPFIGDTYAHTAKAWLAQNEPDSALHFYQLALINNASDFNDQNAQQNPSINNILKPLNAINVFEGKAKTYQQIWNQEQNIADLKTAFNNYALAIQAISKTRQSFNAEGSKLTLAEKVIPIYEGAIETAFNLFEATGNKEWLTTGFQFAEGNKAAALFDAIQKNEALGTANIPDTLLNQEYSLKADIAFHEQLIHDAKQQKQSISDEKIKVLKNKLFNFKEAYQKLMDGFENNYPDYFALKFKQEPIDIQAIQKKLEQSVLIEFFIGLENIFVFTISGTDIHCHKTPKTDAFEKDIKVLRKIITTAPKSKTIGTSIDQFSIASNRLYQTLLKSLIEQLSPQTKNLMIIPDDLLAYLPFSILIRQANKSNNTNYKNLDYLSNRFGISYNYSAALWFKHLEANSEKAKKKFVGFAPEFSAYQQSNTLSPLSCNTKEVEKLGALLGTEDLRHAEAATLENFNTVAADYQIIHLATHATLDGQNSDFNQIYFSDQSLNQNDLYQLKLNASLVVLSACNTGSGTLKKGEGVMSLSRGFTHAGCPSILMSLWSVDDCVTADIMLDYYTAINDGQSKETALQSAKASHLNQSEDILQAHPYYWAAFVQYGNTAPLQLNASKRSVFIMAGIFILALLTIVFFVKNKKSSL